MWRILAVLIAALALASSVSAEPRGYGWRGGHGWHGHSRYWRPDPGSAFLGGLIGGVVGAWFTPSPPPVIVLAPPVPELVPWSPQWMDYCQSKYRSFDARSGFYTGYDQQQHFCQ